MKLKEVERTAVQAWSPAGHHPICLAAGTSAQQLDASFNTSATLDIFEVDFRDPSLEMKCRGSLSTANRFHKLIWGRFASGGSDPSGVIAGGGDNGVITLYSASQILTSANEPAIDHVEKHTGPVRALDFNPFQDNLLASGANNSEIYIWDLNNFSMPMTPGTKSQPPEDIIVVAWNQQVQHILSSAHPSGKAVVWDLRKNEPIIKVSDHSNRMLCSGMAWHPEIATQLVLSSEDDRLPVIQIWDLRFATSPLSQLEGHTRGVLSLSWCQADPDLLLTSAKDSRILCWNLCPSEVVYELRTPTQWCFEVQWCPQNPSVFSAASFDGRLSLYSVMGGILEAQQKSQADKISSSFSHMDPFGAGQNLLPLQVLERVAAQATLVPPLKKPPKWIRRPTGASFTFGGKLITFGHTKALTQLGQPVMPQQVFISQVTTEAEFLARSQQLQEALQSGRLLDFCQKKIEAAPEPSEENVWNFLKVNLEPECRTKRLKLLGYSKEDLQKKIASYLGNGVLDKQPPPEADDLGQATQAIQGRENSTGKATSSVHFFDDLLKEKPALEIPVSTVATPDPNRDEPPPPPPPVVVNDEEEFEVRQILDSWLHRGQLQYLTNSPSSSLRNGSSLLAATLLFTASLVRPGAFLGTGVLSFGALGGACGSPLTTLSTSLRTMARNSLAVSSSSALGAVAPSSPSSGCGHSSCNGAATIVSISPGSMGSGLGSSAFAIRSLRMCRVRLASRLAGASSMVLVELGPSQLPFTPPALAQPPVPSPYMPPPAPVKPLPSAAPTVPVFSHRGEPPPYSQYGSGIVPAAGPNAPLPQPFSLPGASLSGLRELPAPSFSLGPPEAFRPGPTLLTPTSVPSSQLPMAGSAATQGQPTMLFSPLPLSCPAGMSYPPPLSESLAASSLPSPPTAQESWDSPSALRGSLQRKKVPEFTSPAPITTPIMNLPIRPPGGFPVRFPPSQEYVCRPPRMPTEGSMRFHELPVVQVKKREIPPEHQVLKTTFESLLQRCLSVATDIKTRRKLEDATQRLECLYEKLQEQALSQPILLGLHELTRCAEAGSYQQALAVHTQVVNSSRFSDVSGFMPVLKALLTIAQKLDI
ncbi:protein transport protein Sec31B [Heteronotia binoei]|uniref:protein transport protein Sec31B n=1 Tax=Heteronotia binoei TaxID=13085 RepID=UPI0029303B81|nr:protein transport protein Sec31B [Heteronotia binoei]